MYNLTEKHQRFLQASKCDFCGGGAREGVGEIEFSFASAKKNSVIPALVQCLLSEYSWTGARGLILILQILRKHGNMYPVM